MNHLFLPRLVLLLAGLPGLLGAADWQALTGNSPFGVAAPAAASTAAGDLEFRGVVQEEDIFLVNLYNPATKTSQWVAVNGQAPGLEVNSYDASSDKVQITQAGRPLTLPLKQARVALVALVAAAAVPAGGTAANAENETSNGVSPEDRRAQIRDMIRARLENSPNGEPSPLMRNLPPEAQAMIEEFRRRRAEGRGGNGGTDAQVQGQTSGQNQGSGQRQRRERPQN